MNHFCACSKPSLLFVGHTPLVPKINNNEQQTPCTSQTARIKRPMNPFILWSSEKRKKIAKENPKLHNSEISKQLGEEWRILPQKEKQTFIDRSNQLREEHRKRYPNYKYCPRKKTKPEDTSRSINSQLEPANNYTNDPFNLCVGYLDGIPFSSGYACSSCWMPFSPMAPFHYSSIQHPQTSSQIYYSDTGPSTLMPANIAPESSTALVTANIAIGPHNAFVSANTAIGSHNAFVSANTARGPHDAFISANTARGPHDAFVSANTASEPHDAFISANIASGPHNAFVSANTTDGPNIYHLLQ